MAFQTLINGIPDQNLPLTDRGLAYGDGVFETFRLIDGEVLLFDRHWQRLSESLKRLNIPLPLTEAELKTGFKTVISDGVGVAKLIVTRGSGGRGYRVPDQPDSQWILQGFPLPESNSDHYLSGVGVRSCELKLSDQPVLAGMKHLNRLEQVMARSEWQDEYFEGLLFSQTGALIEATMANLFIIQGSQLLTPKLDLCGVQGVMRDAILNSDVAILPGITESKESALYESALLNSDAAFICNSVRGIIPLTEWSDSKGVQIRQWESSAHPDLLTLMELFHQKLALPYAGR
ncbi:aminodeoxychorismate lyase [Oceanospirillum sanctuarii]|uniref:aminodeoxychorismate lyase n=1 Tax=Oceanospirillum sanctuarii TaxID=1434821 RepID=UPI000A36B647|nr:aminodeoxychorismate lyase [Oceanospirillum sanctuarii]